MKKEEEEEGLRRAVEMKKTADELCDDLLTLQELAARGSWRMILDKINTNNNKKKKHPHQHLIHLTFSSLSLLKLRRYSDALSLLHDHTNVLDDTTTYRYESYPDLYPNNRTGSMVPFALRWILAILPSYLSDRPLSLDRLYTLLDFVNSNIIDNNNNNNNNDGGGASILLVLWDKRRVFVVNSIISLHLGNKEFAPALGLIHALLKDGVLDPVLLSKLGYIQMQIGDLEGAKSTFSKVEGLVDDKLDEVWARNLVGRNKALGYLVGKDYSSAVREYEECVERDAADVVAVNNKAICLMYLRELSGSITVLEGALERIPTVALNEPIVVNLCSMYELAYVNHLDIKKTLSSWIAKVAPDDFDTSCTRI